MLITHEESRYNSVSRDAPIVIVVSPADRGGKLRAFLDGELLVTSRQPFFAAARKLLDRGFDPNRVVEMWHCGARHFSLRARLGLAAQMAVTEDKYGVRLAPWRPFSRTAVAPAIAPLETGTLPAAEGQS